ncbi:MAG: TonB-dependent receptor [Acidobacteria bacterium]|nr:TonB-dependent receptor [Acidobacteriota bacterium]
MNRWWLVLLPWWVWAQSSTVTGTLECRVADSTGAAVAQARLFLRHSQSGAARSVLTDEQGMARLAGLPGGVYALRLDRDGFNTIAVDDVQVAVGQTVVQRITMTLAAVTERLEVQERADSLQTTATTANVSLGGERIEEAPAPNRNYLNFVLAAPGVVASPRANTSRSAAGMRNVANDSGFVFVGIRGRNNSISIDGLDNRDETTGGNRVTIGLEMVQEFRVAGASVGAEFGGAAGGLVNVVTRSGENLWHGDFTFFQQNEFANARNPEAPGGVRPRFRRYQPGVSVGGPARRDRTFFFTAFEQSWESSQEWSQTPSSLNGHPGLTQGLFDTGERDTVFSLKASHRAGERHTLSGRYAFSRGVVQNDVQTVDNFSDRSARASSAIADHSLVGGWSFALNAAMLNDLRFQYSQRSGGVTPNGAGPMYEIPGVLTFGRSYRSDQERTERHAEIVESLQWSRGRHLLSAGASVHAVWFDGRLAHRFHGAYIFPSLEAFEQGRPDVFFQAFGDPHTAMNTIPAGGWLQDRWQITPGLSIEAGVRYDFQRLPAGFPSPVGNVAPRAGVAWHPAGSSKWVFRAGAGLFFDRYPLEYLNDAIQKDGVRGFDLYLSAAMAERVFALTRGGALSSPIAGAPASVYRAAPGFTSTYSRKLAGGMERKLDNDTTFTVEFSDVRGLHLPRVRNASLMLPPQYHLEQTATSAYRGVALSVNRRLRKDLTYLVHYNLSRTKDDASDFDEQPLDPANLRADWAPARHHQRHRLAFSGLFEAPGRITLAPVFSWGSGRPLNTLLAGDVYRTGAYPISARPAGFARNSRWTPGAVSLDLRVMKTVKVKEGRARLQFGVEGFNLLNHTNRLRVSPYWTSSFGGIVEAQNARQIQMMVQLEY